MAYSFRIISKQFQQDIAEIEVLINNYSATVKSFERDLILEACFFRMIVVWENFLEEYFLRCMCTATTKSNKQIRPKTNPTSTINDAFKKLHLQRKDRDKDYLDWLDPMKLEQRVNDYFHHKSRLHSIYADRNQLNISRTIRNLIAHNSKKSLKDFESYIINNLGYLPLIEPNAADLLLSRERRSGKFFIIIYFDYYKQLEKDLSN